MRREFAIEFCQVGVTSEGEEKVRSLTFGIGCGEFVVFVGPRGARKSLLLELCGGIISPSQGVVKTLGVDLTRTSRTEQSLLRRRIGMVFQKPALLNNLTVFENVALPLHYHTVLDNDAVHGKVMARLSELGISLYRDLFPTEITHGKSKLVALARALVLGQELILIDDPFAGLDDGNVMRLTSIFEHYQAEGRVTIVVAMSNPSHLLHMANRVALVLDGRIVEMGSLTEVYNNVDEERERAYVTWEDKVCAR
tara:strand:+ start:5843 stop:6601 length:759 start_codon:yes stop_codon:yes gene_type:complete